MLLQWKQPDHMGTLREYRAILETNPIIAAVKNLRAAEKAAASPVGVAFILGGDILTLPSMMDMLRQGGKKIFLHIDLVEGIGRDAAGVRFLSRVWHADGMISTRTSLLRTAAEEGLCTVQRMFLLDSASLASGIALVSEARPDMVELMPGLLDKAISQFSCESRRPVIAGGMITEKREAMRALAAGALAVSTSQEALWNL